MTLLLARVRASKEKTKEATYVKDVGTRAHSVLSLRSFSLQFHFLQPFTSSHGHFCSNRSHRRHRELSLSLSHFFLCKFRNPSSVRNNSFFFFLGNENLGFLKHNDWNLREDTKALQFLQVSLSRSLFTLKNVFISFCNLLSFFFFGWN